MSSESGSFAPASGGSASVTRNLEEISSENDQNAGIADEMEESIENLSAEMIARRGYVNISRNNLQDLTTTKFAQMIVRENSEREVPIPHSIVKAGYAFRLGYPSQKERDTAVLHGLVVDSVMVEIEPPTPRILQTTFRKTIYIFGIPEEESNVRVGKFLEKDGLKPVSDFRKLFIPDTVIAGVLPGGIWNGGRSVVVEAPIGTKIPAFARYKSPTLKTAPKINIWYPGMGDWCRICLAEGHRASGCPTKNRRWEAVADEFEEMAEWKELMSKLTSEYGDNIVPFFTKENPFSNHYLCEVKVDNVSYKSTEHCLFAKRAIHCNDLEAAEEIKGELTAVKAMKRGQMLPFPGGAKPWHKFAKEVLEAANLAKFKQNDDLRRHLFGTFGKRLVEASTDGYWGCGHSLEALKSNPNIHHPEKWRGFNVMGDILTHLRRNLMSDGAYVGEATVVRNEMENRSRVKRPRESPNDANPKGPSIRRVESTSSLQTEQDEY